MDKGLRRNPDFGRGPPVNPVSILGLVDKGLRPFHNGNRPYSHNIVSILGLVDKGLRLCVNFKGEVRIFCFNPWFSG